MYSLRVLVVDIQELVYKVSCYKNDPQVKRFK